MKKILIYLDNQRFANPFDLIMSLDSGFDYVIPYSGINSENVDFIVNNAIFPRSPNDCKNTVIYIGGSVEEAEKTFRKIKEIMRYSIQLSVIFDPSGACTTAAAAVAKMDKMVDGLRGKKTTILAGTGPIGEISATLCSTLGSEVTITSRTREKAVRVANSISDKSRGKVYGVQGGTLQERVDACKDADVVMATGTLGVQLIDSESLSKISPKLLVDVNVVEPFGIDGLDPNKKLKELHGAKALDGIEIGLLKNKVEAEILKEATEKIAFYDQNDALKIARRLCECE
jgi:methylenetetrahydrofolate/methylenetetrahydromethanopterin dehydrogenase (NADP+)